MHITDRLLCSLSEQVIKPYGPVRGMVALPEPPHQTISIIPHEGDTEMVRKQVARKKPTPNVQIGGSSSSGDRPDRPPGGPTIKVHNKQKPTRRPPTIPEGPNELENAIQIAKKNLKPVVPVIKNNIDKDLEDKGKKYLEVLRRKNQIKRKK